MSECVVRMEMPKGCWGCPFGHYDWIWGDDGREKMVCFCCLDGESEEDGHYLLETEEKRPSWCPIICQLPEGHGDLISRNAVAIACPGQIRIEDGEYWIRLSKVRESIKSAPTIVPAERSEL